MKRWIVRAACSCAIALLAAVPCGAIRAAGKYCGTVIFDRWDGCTLYSGIYVMYIGEKAKETLRPYAGKAIQIDAQAVYQPINPGDGRIDRLAYLGPAPKGPTYREWKDLRLTSSVKVAQNGKLVAVIIVENRDKAPVEVLSGELAPTLLMKRPAIQNDPLFVSDGPSFALFTRQSFEIGSSEPRWQSKGIAAGVPCAWTIGKDHALPHAFTLGPNQKKQIEVEFTLPDGEYDFLCGHGGGVHESRSLASNLSAFDVKDGKVQIVAVKRK